MRFPKFAIAAVALVLIAVAVFCWLTPQPQTPIQFSMVRMGNEAPGPPALVRFTNHSQNTFRWDLHTFVFTDGTWVKAAQQPKIEYGAATLRAHQSWTHAVPVPDGRGKWKVELRCRGSDSRLENWIEHVFRLVKMKSPFRDSDRHVIIEELEFER